MWKVLMKVRQFLLSRTFVCALLALLQIAFFLSLFFVFSQFGTMAYTAITILSVLAIVVVFEKDDINPAYKMMWILIVVAMPISGYVFYALFGGRQISRRNMSGFMELEQHTKKFLTQSDGVKDHLVQTDATLARTVSYLSKWAASPLYDSTQMEYYKLGEDFFVRFIEEIQKAQRSIYMEYFIIEPGAMWNETLEILKAKAAQGLDVRVLFDSIGSLFTLPNDYEKTLRSYGIQCYPVNEAHFSWHLSDYKMLNNRDHRKITIVDNEIAFTGGINFADEYINSKKRFGVWKDTALMLRGPGTYTLTVTFLKMWDYWAGSLTQYTDYMPRGNYQTDGYVQPYCDSPLDSESVSENAYFCLIERAQNYLYITTPYLIIDSEMETALCLAAKSGVDVRIIMPGVPDKWYVYYVTQSYYTKLLRNGVRIYEYTPGFLHAKMYVSDDKVAAVGSVNMDYRSLFLHFENCCMFYGGHMIKDVKRDFDEMLGVSHEVTIADSMRVSWFKRLLQIIFRFFAPLM